VGEKGEVENRKRCARAVKKGEIRVPSNSTLHTSTYGECMHA